MGALYEAPGDSDTPGKLPNRGGLRPSDWLRAAERDEGPGPWNEALEIEDRPGSGVAVSEVSFESSWRGVGICLIEGVPGTGEASRAVEKLLPGEPNGEESLRENDVPDCTGCARDEPDADRLCDSMTGEIGVYRRRAEECRNNLGITMRCDAIRLWCFGLHPHVPLWSGFLKPYKKQKGGTSTKTALAKQASDRDTRRRRSVQRAVYVQVSVRVTVPDPLCCCCPPADMYEVSCVRR